MLTNEYVAGIIDGEGTLKITLAGKKHVKTNRRNFQAVVSLEMREEFLIDALVKRFGGAKWLRSPRKETHSVMYGWKISGQNLDIFLSEVGPHIWLKSKQVSLLQEFRHKVLCKTHKMLSDGEYQDYKRLFDLNCLCNKKGPKN
jgi:hypothetical protein